MSLTEKFSLQNLKAVASAPARYVHNKRDSLSATFNGLSSRLLPNGHQPVGKQTARKG